MKRGNGGFIARRTIRRAFNCYPADEIKLKLRAKCAPARAYDIAPYLPTVGSANNIAGETPATYELFLTLRSGSDLR